MLRFLCLLAILLPRIVLAMCGSQSLTVWPALDHALPANGQVVLQGYGHFEAPVATIAERSPRLVADKDEVPLRVVAVYRGEMNLTQAVLQPERPLQPGQRYTLHLTQPEGASSPPLPTETQSKSGNAPIAWTVTDADVKPPRWRAAPRKKGASAERMGCGPSIHVHVSASVDEEGPQVHVLAEVRRADGGEPVRFRLTPGEEQVHIGHGMCSGAFQLKEGMRYTVRLVAVDMAGNESAAPGAPVRIVGHKRSR
ncbi:hypothetical protein [Hyalangium sp.]|uniref:hypothetical protein n=1 Tax=Hyalangium sp. TaxID=2028555 RepID=UPI002D549741|nr:hypothetical protein [Hyalangium sp.]HYI01239.1 hypothetical protein [Hyalangium sp.]